jgi:GT2 family glycosyltransferase
VKASPLTWDYFLLLNPDTVVPPKNLSRWLGSAITLREKSPISLGILVPRLLNFNGVEQRSVYRFVTGASYWSNHSIFAGFIKEWKKGRESMSALLDISGSAPATSDSNSIAEIDWAMGAAYLIPWSAWQAVGGFDEAYFLYAEDMDFCWRLRKKGYGIFQDTSISILHDQGSPQGTQRGMQQVMLFDGIRLFLDRTQPFSNRVIVKICILMDMALRLCGFAIPAVLSGGRGIFAVRFSASLHTAWRTLLSANSSRPPTPLKSD